MKITLKLVDLTSWHCLYAQEPFLDPDSDLISFGFLLLFNGIFCDKIRLKHINTSLID